MVLDKIIAELDSSFPVHRIGPKIREIRKKQGLKLGDFANKVGTSNAMMSKIENGRVVPTLPKLLDITKHLNLTPEEFFRVVSDDDFQGYVLIPKERYELSPDGDQINGLGLRSVFDRSINAHSFKISHVTLKPGNGRPPNTTDAFEYLYVINGELEYHLEDKVLDLKEGDSLFIDGRIEHVPINPLTVDVNYLVVNFFTQETKDN